MESYININFQSLEGLKEKIKLHARSLIGNGFVWVIDHNGSLEVVGTPNYSTPLVWKDSIPILGLPLWQHSYFLDHKEDVDGYVDAWFRVVNWGAVQDHLAHAGPLPATAEIDAAQTAELKQQHEALQAEEAARAKREEETDDLEGEQRSNQNTNGKDQKKEEQFLTAFFDKK